VDISCEEGLASASPFSRLPPTSLLAELMDHVKMREDISELLRFYVGWRKSPLVVRLKVERCQLLEWALTWWGGLVAYGNMEG